MPSRLRRWPCLVLIVAGSRIARASRPYRLAILGLCVSWEPTAPPHGGIGYKE